VKYLFNSIKSSLFALEMWAPYILRLAGLFTDTTSGWCQALLDGVIPIATVRTGVLSYSQLFLSRFAFIKLSFELNIVGKNQFRNMVLSPTRCKRASVHTQKRLQRCFRARLNAQREQFVTHVTRSPQPGRPSRPSPAGSRGGTPQGTLFELRIVTLRRCFSSADSIGFPL
jgi:hypothetical protein